MNAVVQNALKLQVRRDVMESVADEILDRCESMTAAIVLCVTASGINEKVLCAELEIDPGHYARMKTGIAHFPPDKLLQLMEVCGNEIPMRWLALRRGKALVRLKSALEQENEVLHQALLEQQRDLDAIKKFMRETRG